MNSIYSVTPLNEIDSALPWNVLKEREAGIKREEEGGDSSPNPHRGDPLDGGKFSRLATQGGKFRRLATHGVSTLRRLKKSREQEKKGVERFEWVFSKYSLKKIDRN